MGKTIFILIFALSSTISIWYYWTEMSKSWLNLLFYTGCWNQYVWSITALYIEMVVLNKMWSAANLLCYHWLNFVHYWGIYRFQKVFLFLWRVVIEFTVKNVIAIYIYIYIYYFNSCDCIMHSSLSYTIY
jgi:hypothetical protein